MVFKGEGNSRRQSIIVVWWGWNIWIFKRAFRKLILLFKQCASKMAVKVNYYISNKWKKGVIVFQFSFVGNSFHFLRGNHYENSEKNVFHAYSQYKCTPLAIRQGKREQHRGHMVSHPINCKCDQKKTPKNIYFKTTSFWEG